jgi:hypothetical protein
MPGVYSHLTHSWNVGKAGVVFFDYRRTNSRSFQLVASRYDPSEGPPSKYMFEDTDVQRNGEEVILRRDKFVWRNGDQTMTAITGDGISAVEIGAIRTAMHGTPIAGVWPPRSRATEKMYRLP